MRKLSLRNRLLASLLGVGLLTLLVAGLQADRRAQAALRTAAIHHLTSIREERRLQIEAYLAGIRRDGMNRGDGHRVLRRDRGDRGHPVDARPRECLQICLDPRTTARIRARDREHARNREVLGHRRSSLETIRKPPTRGLRMISLGVRVKPWGRGEPHARPRSTCHPLVDAEPIPPD